MKFHKEEELLSQIKKAVKKRPASKNLAVLDADGTLWSEDANHILLEYQIQKDKKKFENLLNIENQSYRYKLCEDFVQKQSGLTLAEFQALARQALEQKSLNVFPFQQQLLDYLKKENMRIVIVTASIEWLVELAVEKYNLPVDQVLGMKTKLEGDLITDQIIRPAPISDYKAEVLLDRLPGESCFLAAGNTLTDKPLLEIAEISFIVNSADPDSVIFQTEQKLKQFALQKNWILFEKQDQSIV